MNNKKSRESGAKSFMSGVMVLSLSTLIVKVIGLAFKIPMLSFLGTEGMGYFNSAYEIYALLCVISTAGLPVALSMLVSASRVRNNGVEVERAYSTARALFFILGASGTAVMLCFSEQIALFIGNPNAKLSIIAIAPALLFICLASAIRGYCQGFENMTPTALSQLIEALSKLLFGIAFASFALKTKRQIPEVAAFAVLGITLGTFLSLVYLYFARKKHAIYKEKNIAPQKNHDIIKQLLSIAFPITLGSAVIGLTRIIDMTLIMRRLSHIGFSVAEANRIYGAYTTLALPVFSLIPALITPVSMALVPQLSAYLEIKNREGEQRAVETSLRLTVLFAMPASLGLAVFSRQILELLFSGQNEAIEISAPLLSLLAASVLFSCIMTTTNAILQSYRRVYLPIISMAVGVVIKIVTSYLLIGNPSVRALGAPIGSLLCNFSVALINIYFTYRHSKGEVDTFRIFFKPLFASALAVGVSELAYVWLEQAEINRALQLFIAILVALAIYVGACFIMRIITADDIALLPFADRFNLKKNRGVKNDGL